MARPPSTSGGSNPGKSVERDDSFSTDPSEINLAGADLGGADVSLDADYDAVPTASALSAALDETLEQGGVPSDPNLNEVASDQALLDEANLDLDENQDDVDELFS